MPNVIPAAAGWWASRRARGEIETRRVVGFILSDPQAPVAPIVMGDDGVVSQATDWVVWSENAPEPPEAVLEALQAAGDDVVEERTPPPSYAHVGGPVISEIVLSPGARRW